MNPPVTADNLPAEVLDEILRTSSDAVVVTDKSGAIIFANAEAEKLFGYTAEELADQPVEILIPDVHRDGHRHLRNAFHRMPRARPLLSGMELYGSRKDGSTFRAEIALTPVKTGNGMLVASVVKEARADERAEAYFRTLLESAPDAMIIVDRSGRISIVNAQAERMFGYQRPEMVGQPIEMLLPERLREQHIAHRESYTENPTPRPMGRDFELTARRKDGSEFPVEISLSPTHSSADSFVWSVIRDVTQRKRMEAEIIAARQEAERATKANSAFLAAASHDLRQPVQALNLLNGALRRTVKDERALEMIKSQEMSLTAMTNLLNSLLDISRLDAGATTPEFEEFPMQRLIDRLSAEFGRQARQKGLRFSASGCASTVRSDPNMLAEIIQNLVSNAIRYTNEGRVRLECKAVGDTCRLSVTDTGIGIAPEEVENIFREFHQVRTVAGSNEGFGLGLAIVRRMSDLLGISVSVESELDKGSTFIVDIPLSSSRDAVSDVDSGVPAGGESNGSGLVILIEDDAAVSNAWKLLLEAEGYRVAQAKSATDAAELIRTLDRTPSLLISDFHLLDGSTGVEAVAAIRDHYETEIPAFVVTGDTSKIVKESRLLDNCTLMSKPVDTNRLLAAAGVATNTGHVPDD